MLKSKKTVLHGSLLTETFYLTNIEYHENIFALIAQEEYVTGLGGALFHVSEHSERNGWNPFYPLRSSQETAVTLAI